jgi:hypothetical protein
MDVLAVFLALFLGIVVFFATRRRFSTDEQQLLLAAFVMHVVFAFLQVWVTTEVYEGGDMNEYQRGGQMLASLLRDNFVEFFPEVLKLTFHQPTNLPVEIRGGGGATGTMYGITAFLMFFLADSLYASGLVVTIASYAGKLAIYNCFRSQLPAHLHRRVLVATMLVPSVNYWTAGLIKEAFAMIGLGMILSAMMTTKDQPAARRLALIVLGTIGLGFIKPYILFPIAAATGVWFYFDRALRSGKTIVLKPFHFAFGAAVAVGGVIGLGWIFPEFALDRVGEQFARQQGFAETLGGGSSFTIGDPTKTSTVAQFAFAPVGLVNSLFRPFVFEVRNPQMAISAVEATVLTILFIRAVVVQTWAGLKRQLAGSPLLVFSLVFTIVFGAAVGIATTNLGTLSRYRVPLLPFFAMMLLTLTARDPRRVSAAPLARPSEHAGA